MHLDHSLDKITQAKAASMLTQNEIQLIDNKKRRNRFKNRNKSVNQMKFRRKSNINSI